MLKRGFTLIEIAIVLVIIGLIIGGVLVGQNLVRNAEIRATISQIERYNTAANAFRGKYGYLPGDIKDPEASSFGFLPRGTGRGQGDGNGIIEGTGYPVSGVAGTNTTGGEALSFWVDLSTARMIDGNFNTATPSGNVPIATSLAQINALAPPAKLGQSNYIAIISGGGIIGTTWISNGINYFMMAAVTNTAGIAPGLTPQQAYALDSKIDDGLPLTGRVLDQYFNYTINVLGYVTAAGNGGVGGSPGTAVTPGTYTCYDNGGNANAPMQYSISQPANSLNCAATIQFQ